MGARSAFGLILKTAQNKLNDFLLCFSLVLSIGLIVAETTACCVMCWEMMLCQHSSLKQLLLQNNKQYCSLHTWSFTHCVLPVISHLILLIFYIYVLLFTALALRLSMYNMRSIQVYIIPCAFMLYLIKNINTNIYKNLKLTVPASMR